MAEISLRNYIQNINKLLREERYETAIASSSHILSKYTKYAPAYRALGRALLAQGRIDEASEIYRRLLGAIPDDFDAHFNLSAIYTSQNNANAALWHMERAFDQQPNNPAVDKRMRQLYKRFKDAEIGRIQLTAGAVAKQYITAELYDQAIELLDRTLKRMPDRNDLRLQLAKAYWGNGDIVEAAETALDVLKNLPYALEANRILTLLWIQEERPSDARRYLSRVEDIDPYLAYALATGSEAPAERFTIEELDMRRYQAEQLEKTNPDWLDSLAQADIVQLTDEAGAATEADLDDWLNDIEELATEADDQPAARRKVTDNLNPDTLPDNYEFPASAGTDDTVNDDDLADFEQLVSDAESKPQAKQRGEYREGDLLSQMMDQAKNNPQGPTGMLARFATNEIGGEEDDLSWLVEATTGRFDTGSLAGLAGLEAEEEQAGDADMMDFDNGGFDDDNDAPVDMNALFADMQEQDESSSLDAADPMAWLGGSDQFEDDATDDDLDFDTSDSFDSFDDDEDDDEDDDSLDFLSEIDTAPATDGEDPMAWLGDDIEFDEDAVDDFTAMQSLETQDDSSFESAPNDPMAWLGGGFDEDDDAFSSSENDDDPMSWLADDGIEIDDDDDEFNALSGDVMSRLNAGEDVAPEDVDALFRAGFEKAAQRDDVADYLDDDDVAKADSGFLSDLGFESDDNVAKADSGFLSDLGFDSDDAEDVEENEFAVASSDSDFLSDLGIGGDGDESTETDWMSDSSVLDEMLEFEDLDSEDDDSADDFDFSAVAMTDNTTDGQDEMSDQPEWEANFDNEDDDEEKLDWLGESSESDADASTDDSVAWFAAAEEEEVVVVKDLLPAADLDDPMAWLEDDEEEDDDDEFVAAADEDLLAELGFEAEDGIGNITGDAASDWNFGDKDDEDDDFDFGDFGSEDAAAEGEFDFAEMNFDANALGDDASAEDDFDFGELDEELSSMEDEQAGATGMLARFGTGELSLPEDSASEEFDFGDDEEESEELDWLADLDANAIHETTPVEVVAETSENDWLSELGEVDDTDGETAEEDEFDFAAMDLGDNAIGDEEDDELDFAAMDLGDNAIGDEDDADEFDFAAMDLGDNVIGDEDDADEFDFAAMDLGDNAIGDEEDDELDFAAMDLGDNAIGDEDDADEFDFAAMDLGDNVIGDEEDDELDFAAMDLGDNAIGDEEDDELDFAAMDLGDNAIGDEDDADEFDFAAMDLGDNAIGDEDDADEFDFAAMDLGDNVIGDEEDDELDFAAMDLGDNAIGDEDDADELEFEPQAVDDSPDWLSGLDEGETTADATDADDWEEEGEFETYSTQGMTGMLNQIRGSTDEDDEFVDEEDDEEELVTESPDWLADMGLAEEEPEPEYEDEPIAADLDWLGDDEQEDAAQEEAIPLAENADLEFIGDFEEDLDFGAAESAPDWLNAMVPGLDIDFEAQEDESLEEGSFIHDPNAEENFAWLQAIVDEEIGDQQPLVRDDDEPVAIPTRPMSRGQFVFSLLPVWARSSQNTDTGASVAAASATTAIDDMPDYLTDFDNFDDVSDGSFDDDFDEEAMNDPYDDGYIKSDFDEDFSLDDLDEDFDDDFDDDFKFDDDAF